MCDEKGESSACDSEEAERLSLLDLPVEIILQICSFLDVSTLIKLSLVCKQFHMILKDEFFWKRRVSQIWPDSNYPILHSVKLNKLSWKTLCTRAEKLRTLWKREDYMEDIAFSDNNFSIDNTTMDALLLMRNGTVCVTGARDRTLMCCNIPTSGAKTCIRINCAHNGWIWDLTTMHDTVYSCSWDQTIKSWALTNSNLTQQAIYQINSESSPHVLCAMLSLASCPEQTLFAAGSYNKNVYMFDSRSGCTPITKYKAHTRAVIKMTMNPEYILSVSDDKTMTVWDQRTRQIMKSVIISSEAFPMCISMQQDLICLGDSIGYLHILNPNTFDVVKSYSTGHDKGITAVYLSNDSLITSSTDCTVRMFSPTDPPRPMFVKNSKFGVIANMKYQNDVLAISGTGIRIWRPKSIHTEKM